ncbi:MAG: N-acetylneuraminate synthase [Patescibacteria group bacterium]
MPSVEPKLSPSIRIGARLVGEGQPVFVIAEAGVNHNGNLETALRLVDAAADAGADAVKFQTFKAEELAVEAAGMAEYQKSNLGMQESQLAMLKKLELAEADYPAIIARCRERNILFLSTPHSGQGSLEFLARLNVLAFKFGSGEITNLPFLRSAARYGRPLILGTGMSTLDEVQEAYEAMHDVGAREIVFLHCTSNYPCRLVEVNLRAMRTMAEAFPTPVGYSDHTLDIQVPVMAVAMGASVIEKHFTLSRSMPGPDHASSLEPDELKRMVLAIRKAETILGSAHKRPNPSEFSTMAVARKSLVTTAPVRAGERFTASNVGIKRPGTGLLPNLYDRLLSHAAKRDLSSGHVLTPDDVAGWGV